MRVGFVMCDTDLPYAPSFVPIGATSKIGCERPFRVRVGIGSQMSKYRNF